MLYIVGSQLRAWVLFFSLPVLSGKLPRDYLKHFSLLIVALHILLADTISPVDLTSSYLSCMVCTMYIIIDKVVV